jgi:hypothetical protein
MTLRTQLAQNEAMREPVNREWSQHMVNTWSTHGRAIITVLSKTGFRKTVFDRFGMA